MKKLLSVFAMLLALCCLVSCEKTDESAFDEPDVPEGSLVSCEKTDESDFDEPDVPEGSLALCVSNVTAKPGETVEVAVKLFDNQKLGGFSFCLVPPEGFTASEAKVDMADNTYSFVKTLEDGSVNFAWTSLTLCTDDRVIARMNITVPENAVPGTYDVKLHFRPQYDMFYTINSDGTMPEYDVVLSHGTITVE